MKLTNCIICNKKLKGYEKKTCSSTCYETYEKVFKNQDKTVTKEMYISQKEYYRYLKQQKEIILTEYEVLELWKDIIIIKETTNFNVDDLISGLEIINDRMIKMTKRLAHMLKK